MLNCDMQLRVFEAAYSLDFLSQRRTPKVRIPREQGRPLVETESRDDFCCIQTRRKIEVYICHVRFSFMMILSIVCQYRREKMHEVINNPCKQIDTQM